MYKNAGGGSRTHTPLRATGFESATENSQHAADTGVTQLPAGGAERALKITPEDAPAHPPTDPELQTVVEAWPTLPAAIRVGILAMVKAAERGES